MRVFPKVVLEGLVKYVKKCNMLIALLDEREKLLSMSNTIDEGLINSKVLEFVEYN